MPRPIKLLTRDTLTDIYNKVQEGKPLTQIAAETHYPVSLPTLYKLCNAYTTLQALSAKKGRQSEVYKALDDSLFPPWLQEDGQVQDPAYVSYEGSFPSGKWRYYGSDLKWYEKKTKSAESDA